MRVVVKALKETPVLAGNTPFTGLDAWFSPPFFFLLHAFLKSHSFQLLCDGVHAFPPVICQWRGAVAYSFLP
ncbi:hypothetical protein [Brenneria izbisi]|uniref:Uncharacterized protein n=1 Tax=Brenneria izbisi TaxID=2939450 RepID=A0AA41Y2Y7_9GAMM|nr:hypothetical protein [Brenneria izbisi]MCV9878446.1 hypothetical protein [Brenneria izbisi]MCV9881869.1 hypothetical protein [Brenneria izbisi]